jgi:phosphatidate cytidylyltransferase
MALNMPTFYKRTGSAIVFAIVMLGGLLWDQRLIFLALVLLINALCLRDYCRLMQKIDPTANWPKWLQPAIQLVAFYFIAVFWVSKDDYGLEPVLWGIFRILPAVPAILLLVAVLFKKTTLPALLHAIGGLFYITLPLVLFIILRKYSFVIPIALIFMIWINDTMAYLVGSFIGKTPFSSISPNKTWEGTAGGALITIIVAGIYGYFSEGPAMYHWIMIALFATVAGTLGDLLESKLKRIAGVKDSGTLMPGHGGALDRFDSILVALPFVFVYYMVAV